MTAGFVDRLALELRSAAEREAGRTRRARSRTLALGGAALLAALALIAVLVLRPAAHPVRAPLHAVDRVRLTGNPGAITAAYGSVWVPDNVAGVVLRVDPRTRALQARIRIGSGQPFRIAAGAGALWLPEHDGTGVMRIDPRGNELTHHRLHTPDGAPFFVADLAAGGGSVWAVGPGGALRVDPVTGEGARLAGVAEADWAAMAGDTFWFLTTDGRLYALDPASGLPRSVAPTRVGGADPILGDPSGVTAAAAATLVRVAADGKVAWRRRLGLRVNELARQGKSLWVHVSERRGPDRLVELDAATGRERSSLALATFGATGLAAVGDELWLDTPVGDTLILGRQRTP